jgi:hypothetical protein
MSIARSESMDAPLRRFPPLTRGEPRKAQARFPLRAGGTCRRGSSTAVFCELWFGDWYYFDYDMAKRLNGGKQMRNLWVIPAE